MSIDVAVHDRRDRIEEGERLLAGQRADRVGQRRRGEGAGRHDDLIPVVRRQRDLLAPDLDQRMLLERGRDGGREAVAIDRERPAGRHLMGVGCAHHQRAEPAHLRVQQADRVGLAVVGAERVGAHQLGQAVGLVGVGRPLGRISCSTTGTPRPAICHAASLPARPPPMT